jgi:hypothetical protein
MLCQSEKSVVETALQSFTLLSKKVQGRIEQTLHRIGYAKRKNKRYYNRSSFWRTGASGLTAGSL